MAPEVVDLSADDALFDPAAWIGKHKEFPRTNLHSEVHTALGNVLKLPSAHTSVLPGPNLPITKFLKLSLPKKTSALLFSGTGTWFSADTPTTSTECLLARSIPPREVIEDLMKEAGQAWLDGAKSIVDPRFNDGRERFPIWALTLWSELLKVVDDQRRWQHSCEWIESELGRHDLDAVDRDALTNAKSIMDSLGWNTKIHGRWTILDLATVLSNAWLSDDHIDMMMIDLSARVAADPALAAKLIVAPLAFSQAIKNAAQKKKYTREDTPLLARYEQHIKKTHLTQLYFPMHVNANHWIVGFMDFEQGLIGTGDSRVGKSPPPLSFIKELKRWGKKQFGKDFIYQGDSLEHGDQKDATSCGVLCRNTVAANVFGEEVWEQRHAAGARAACFIRLVRSAAIRELVRDHNFPDLAEFASACPVRTSLPSLADLLNPAPELPTAPTPSEDVEMADTATSVGPCGYIGDHGDIGFDTSNGEDVDVNAGVMDVDQHVEGSETRGTLLGYFGVKGKSVQRLAKPQELGKRARTSSLDESTDVGAIKRPKKANGSGISKSATALQKTRDALKSGELTVATADKKKYAGWQQKLRVSGLYPDPDVRFHPTDVKLAYHSLCGTWVTMGEAYETGRWNHHCKTQCPKLNPGKRRKIGAGLTGVPTLRGMGWGGGKAKGESKKLTRPCPGITTSTCPRLPVYLKRTGAGGGGARSVTTLARELFGKVFRRLKNEDKEQVANAQRHERVWVNDHGKQRVFHTSCKKQVLAAADGSRILPCSECSSVLSHPRFKQAIRCPVPADENYIYVNHQYRNKELGEIYARAIGLKEIIETADAKNTPCIKFAQGTLQGKYDDFSVFSGLVEAMVQKVDRVERGVGMQNFKYPPAWEEMAHIVNIHSPRAAKALREHIPLPSHRSFRAKEAREPRFPMEIGDRTFKLVEDYLAAVKYEGPVGLSCDDTKLFPGLRLYTDKVDKCDYLIGGVDGPIRVADPEAMKKVLADAKIVKATKVRLWCLTVPLPGITPLVVAAMPIPDNMTAEQLIIPLEKILYGLLERNIRVISYACDGTESERLLQRMLVDRAERKIHYTVTNPTPGAPDLEITIAVIHGQPVVMIQDSKHALKTFRNNLFTGAKLLTLGNFTALYHRICRMALDHNSPMYRRDVLRLDRQDDIAALRLFSAAVLEFLSENHPDYIGEIVYLFVFGELVDAYQSREISHAERIKIALRSRYFLDAWAKYLEAAGYKAQYFLSREAVDIARYLIDGIISLVLVHRDYIPGTFPLLPWFHASEPCEHTFGNSRDIVKDFSFLDFIFMIPKLRVTMREAVLAGKSSSGRSAAQGYSHTYYDAVGADLIKLAVYPTDAEIKEAALEAAAECDSLIALLGVAPAQFRVPYFSYILLYEHVPAPLPSIDAWFSEGPALSDDDLDSENPPLDFAEEFDNTELPVLSEAEELQAVIDAEERLDAPLRTLRDDRKIRSLTCAAIAIAADEHMRVQQFQEEQDDLVEEMLGDEYITLQETLKSVTQELPPVQLPADASKPFGQGPNPTFESLDFKALVRQRKQHQTRQAANCARTKKDVSDSESPVASEGSLRCQILRRFHELLKEDQARGVGTAVERDARWHTDPKLPAGNAANAAATAAATATKVCLILCMLTQSDIS
ncbi:hypothetical protein B0H15DRAFT_769608 [Mycena belliarum]|uniref:Ubiquitin-like protease family profile domain-containing protein n=1 Tax=Mycena belliarum TaxID=1033014 RepID=A0AAD6UGD9_9AGAR|nr:hypothetical protein B0H15DRAFT_769608 [Mycena belliae]